MVRIARSHEDPESVANRQTASLAALALTLGLVVIGLFLVGRLRAEAELQECLLAGRPACFTLASAR